MNRNDSTPPIIITVIMVAAAVFVLLGRYHIVSGVPGMLVKKHDFGFQDTFAAKSDCTQTPWLVALANHGPLCTALQRDGILESDQQMLDRATKEITDQVEQIQRQMAPQ